MKTTITEKAKATKSPAVEPTMGVIATIVNCIEKAGKKGISKEEILAVLVEAFPDRPADSMKNTINVQVPNRITKERWPVSVVTAGFYKKA